MVGHERTRLAGHPPTAKAAWKRALSSAAAAALRLHHYRFVRTRMLHDALSARDADGADCR